MTAAMLRMRVIVNAEDVLRDILQDAPDPEQMTPDDVSRLTEKLAGVRVGLDDISEEGVAVGLQVLDERRRSFVQDDPPLETDGDIKDEDVDAHLKSE